MHPSFRDGRRLPIRRPVPLQVAKYCTSVPLWEVRGRRNIVQVSITPKYSTSCNKFTGGPDRSGGYYYFHRSCVHIPVPRYVYGRTRVALFITLTHKNDARPDDSCGTIQHAPRHGRSVEWKLAVKLYGVMHTTQPGSGGKSVVFLFIEISRTMGASR